MRHPAAEVPSQWGITWKTPVIMTGTFVLALGAAIGNHLLYASLHDQTPQNQDWYLRSGTALAVVCKMCLTACIGVSFDQRAWRVARRSFLSIEGLDTLFTAVSKPWAVLSGELWGSAKLCLLLALFVWLGPLVPILAPGSLTVRQKILTSQAAMPIPTLDFNITQEALEASDRSLSLFSYYPVVGKQINSAYGGPSKAGRAIVLQTIYQGQIANARSPCGPNCTFSQVFDAPAYSCEVVDAKDPLAPWCYEYDHSLTEVANAPNGSCYTQEPGYTAFRGGNKMLFEVYAGDNSTTTGGKSDAKLWVKHRYYAPENRRNITLSSSSSGIRDEALKVLAGPHEVLAFRCEIKRHRFNVKTSFTDFIPTMSTEKTPLQSYSDLYLGPSIPLTVYKGPVIEYEKWTAAAIHDAIKSVFGIRFEWQTLQLAQTWVPSEGLSLAGTPFAESYPWPPPLNSLPIRNLRQAIEDLSVNITLSLFATRALSCLSSKDGVDVTTTSARLAWNYDVLPLVVTYAVALGAGLVAMVMAWMAMLRSGVSMDSGFATVVATTRNPKLDELARGACLGAAGSDGRQALGEVKVRFGEVGTSDDGSTVRQRHAAFGVESEVTALEKGARYE